MENEIIIVSWSGKLSHEIAKNFAECLDLVIGRQIGVFISDDIDMGSRWREELDEKLEQCKFGILIITKDNMNSPWLNFEAGAISKCVSKSKIVPILFDAEPSMLPSTFSTFQAIRYKKEDLQNLFSFFNDKLNRPIKDFHNFFQKNIWPNFEKNTNKIKELLFKKNNPSETASPISTKDKLEKILLELRSVTGIIKNPEAVLPKDYLVSVIQNAQDLWGQQREREYIRKLQDEIDGYRGLNSENAAQKIRANILKLNRLGFHEFILTDCFLSNMDFRKVDLRGSILSNASLSKANLMNANLQDSTLISADMSDSVLVYANLKFAEMSRAKLEGANLSYADLCSVNLQNADMRNTNLEGANLNGANLLYVKGLYKKQLSKMRTGGLFKAYIDNDLSDKLQKDFPHLFDDQEDPLDS